jgi:hypothetical protein
VPSSSDNLSKKELRARFGAGSPRRHGFGFVWKTYAAERDRVLNVDFVGACPDSGRMA